MSQLTRRRRAAVAGALVAALVAAGCDRPASQTETGGGAATAASTAAAAGRGTTAGGAAPGDFGTEKAICGPGTAKGATARGVTDSTITIGVMGDPGAVAAAGLGQEFFDVGTSFATWCNAAGGIDGRKIKVVTYDAKLFEAGPRMLEACRTAFMLVGGGNAVDAPGVAPRLACKLGQIPAYTVSPEATQAGLQVQPTPNPSDQYQIGPFWALARLFPAAVKKFGIGGINIASLRPQGLRLREALQKMGYQVVDLQSQPALVDNWRPYMEEFKSKGVRAFQEISTLDITPLIRAMNDVGWKPDYLLAQAQLYDPRTIAAANVTDFPTTYTFVNHYPFELASQNAATRQALAILRAGVKNPRLTDFTAMAFKAWVLWAKSASACGSGLTTACVLAKAGAERSFTAGGFTPPTDMDPAHPSQPTCFAMMKVTKAGFVYDRAATRPNTDIYNCAASNVVSLSQTYEGG